MSAAKGNSWDAGPTQPAVFLPWPGSEGPLDRRHLDSAKPSTELLTLKKVEVDQSRRNTGCGAAFPDRNPSTSPRKGEDRDIQTGSLHRRMLLGAADAHLARCCELSSSSSMKLTFKPAPIILCHSFNHLTPRECNIYFHLVLIGSL